MLERGLVKTSGGYIHYRADGQGKPLILLHCMPRSSTSFLDVLPLLGKKCRAIAWDTPGYGDSDHPSRPYLIADYAQALSEFMAGLGLKKATLLGESTGRLIAIELATTHPEKVEKLILQSPAYYPDQKFRQGSQNEISGSYRTNSDGFPMPRTLKEATEWDKKRRPRNPTMVWLERENADLGKAGKTFLQGFEASLAYYPKILPGLKALTCPTLLVVGEFFYYRQFVETYTSTIKDVRLAIIPGAQLMPQYDNPEEMVRVITEFVAGP